MRSIWIEKLTFVIRTTVEEAVLLHVQGLLFFCRIREEKTDIQLLLRVVSPMLCMCSTASLTDWLKNKLDTETEGSNDVRMAWSTSNLNVVSIKDGSVKGSSNSKEREMLYDVQRCHKYRFLWCFKGLGLGFCASLQILNLFYVKSTNSVI